MKKTLITLIIVILLIISIMGIYVQTVPVVEQTDPYEAKIQAIMQRPEFIKSIRLQAETVQAKEDKQAIEKKLEELRKAELELASTSKQSVLK